MASLLQWLVPFPQPWCALLGGTSVAIQLASPWINPDERWMATAGGQPSATLLNGWPGNEEWQQGPSRRTLRAI